MLPKETEQLKKLKDNYIFLTNQCYREMKRNNRVDAFEACDQFIALSKKFRENLGETSSVWGGFEKCYVTDPSQPLP